MAQRDERTGTTAAPVDNMTHGRVGWQAHSTTRQQPILIQTCTICSLTICKHSHVLTTKTPTVNTLLSTLTICRQSFSLTIPTEHAHTHDLSSYLYTSKHPHFRTHSDARYEHLQPRSSYTAPIIMLQLQPIRSEKKRICTQNQQHTDRVHSSPQQHSNVAQRFTLLNLLTYLGHLEKKT